MEAIEPWLNPAREEKIIREQYKQARKSRDQEAAERLRDRLVHLYLHFGEYFKMSDRPDPQSAKHYLKKARELQPDHPVVNYRYAHLLYRDREYVEAIFYFKAALDGNRKQALNDSQTLITQIFLVNCGVMIAREAIKEVHYLQGNPHSSHDSGLIERYASHMLVESEEMLEQHVYHKITPQGTEPISLEQFQSYPEKMESHEVLLSIHPEGYRVKFGPLELSLEMPAFYVFYGIIRSDHYIQSKDILAWLLDYEMDRINPDSLRKTIQRLRERIPFWNDIVDDKTSANKSERRRKEGITYTLLCHSSVVLP